MFNVLDNPAWNALLSGNKQLAYGDENVKFFDPSVSPFAGLRENTPQNFQTLYNLVTDDAPKVVIAPQELNIPADWELIQNIHCWRMVHDKETLPLLDDTIILPLNEQHVPQMLALTRLTNPGPFMQNTINFGHYYGIFSGDQLVAMAGQRMHADDFMEISAVCTHPDHLGKGYAYQLLLFHVYRMIKAGGTPILHVRTDNERAIAVYERLGFGKNEEMYFHLIKKANTL